MHVSAVQSVDIEAVGDQDFAFPTNSVVAQMPEVEDAAAEADSWATLAFPGRFLVFLGILGGLGLANSEAMAFGDHMALQRAKVAHQRTNWE